MNLSNIFPWSHAGLHFLWKHSESIEGLAYKLVSEKQGMSHSTDLYVLCLLLMTRSGRAHSGAHRGQRGCKKSWGLFAPVCVWAGAGSLSIFIFFVCSGNHSLYPRHNPNRKTIEFSDWLHMEYLQRLTVYLGWLSSFFKAIWSLLKLSLFKEPAEKEESILGLREKEEIRFKVANRCGKSRYCPLPMIVLLSPFWDWLCWPLLRRFFLCRYHLLWCGEKWQLLCLFFERPGVFSFSIILSCHFNYTAALSPLFFPTTTVGIHCQT